MCLLFFTYKNVIFSSSWGRERQSECDGKKTKKIRNDLSAFSCFQKNKKDYVTRARWNEWFYCFSCEFLKESLWNEEILWFRIFPLLNLFSLMRKMCNSFKHPCKYLHVAHIKRRVVVLHDSKQMIRYFLLRLFEGKW